jgi:hypothetical protein
MRTLILTASFVAAAAGVSAGTPTGGSDPVNASRPVPPLLHLAAAPTQRPGTPVPHLSLLDALLAPPGTQARVEGYVVDSTVCPAGAQPKPCTGPAQVFLKEIINEAPSPLSMPPTPTLAVAVPDAAVFARGKAYRFEIVTESERTGGVNGRLLRFQLASEAAWPDPAPR